MNCAAAGLVGGTTRLTIELFGSLAWTGMGHGTDTAIILGLCGYEPSTIDPDQIPAAIALIRQTERLAITPGIAVEFVIARDLMFNRTELLPRHSNAMRFVAHDASENIVATRIFYSIGGGFVVGETDDRPTVAPAGTPLPFRNAAELLQLCETKNLSIADV